MITKKLAAKPILLIISIHLTIAACAAVVFLAKDVVPNQQRVEKVLDIQQFLKK